MTTIFPKTAWVLIYKYADSTTFIKLPLVCKMSKKVLHEDFETENRLCEYKDLLICITLFNHSPKSIPRDKWFRELCLKTVKKYGYTLYYIPEEIRTEEICLEAVKRYGYALKYVPEEKRTEEMCLEAVKQRGFALQYIPEEKKPKKCVWKLLNKMDGFYNMFLKKKRQFISYFAPF